MADGSVVARSRASACASSAGCTSRSSTVDRVLDERGQIDATVGRDGESARTVRDSVGDGAGVGVTAGGRGRGARGPVERRPAELGGEARRRGVGRRVGTAGTERGTRRSRADGAHEVEADAEEGRARYEARSLRMWWTSDKGMLHLHGQFPDVMGAKLERTIQRMAERRSRRRVNRGTASSIAPPTRWSGCATRSTVAERVETPTMAVQPLLVVEVPAVGSGGGGGDPVARRDGRAAARQREIEPVLVDDQGLPITVGKAVERRVAKVLRAVMLRDGHCRIPGCEINHGLHAHHLRPKSWDGTDDTVEPRHGLRRRRPPPDARPPRTMGPRRQPQPTRRTGARASGSTHRRAGHPTRAPAATICNRMTTMHRWRTVIP